MWNLSVTVETFIVVSSPSHVHTLAHPRMSCTICAAFLGIAWIASRHRFPVQAFKLRCQTSRRRDLTQDQFCFTIFWVGNVMICQAIFVLSCFIHAMDGFCLKMRCVFFPTCSALDGLGLNMHGSCHECALHSWFQPLLASNAQHCSVNFVLPILPMFNSGFCFVMQMEI